MNASFKIGLISLLTAGAVMFAGNAVLAKGNGNTGFLNGKPFSYLNTQIQQNSSDIQALQDRTEELQAAIDLLNQDMQVLKEQVGNNKARIDGLEAEIASVTGELRVLADEIKRLNGELLALLSDTATNTAAISDLQSKLDGLNTDLNGLSETLNSLQASVLAELAAMKTSLADYQTQADAVNALVQQQIGDLQTKVAELSQAAQGGVTLEDLAEINLKLAGLLAQVISLEIAVNKNTTDIVGIQNLISNLNAGFELSHVHVVHYQDWLWTPNWQYYHLNLTTITEPGMLP